MGVAEDLWGIVLEELTLGGQDMKANRERERIKARAAGILVMLAPEPATAGLISDSSLGAESLARTAQVSSSGPCTGSVSCPKRHEKSYQLWAPDRHGLAIRPCTFELAQNQLTPQKRDIIIGNHPSREDISGRADRVVEIGWEGDKNRSIASAMGGKNVHHFLNTMDRGRLQALPAAYDANKKEWFDAAASGMRRIPGRSDEPIQWKDWQYAFNTACYGCSVSQVSTNREGDGEARM